MVAAALGLAFARTHRGAAHEAVVPLGVQQNDLLTAYEKLHAAGFRVELTRLIAISALRMPGAGHVFPRPGTRVAKASVVRLTPTIGAVGSPAVLKSHPRYTVPRFVGRATNAASYSRAIR